MEGETFSRESNLKWFDLQSKETHRVVFRLALKQNQENRKRTPASGVLIGSANSRSMRVPSYWISERSFVVT